MAPKPPAKPTTPGKGKPAAAAPPAKKEAAPAKKDPKSEVGGSNEPEVAAATSNVAAPKNKEEVLAQVNLDGLPHCPNDQILEILREKYETLVSVFIHYCKQSECKTLEQATRLRLCTPRPPPAPAPRLWPPRLPPPPPPSAAAQQRREQQRKRCSAEGGGGGGGCGGCCLRQRWVAAADGTSNTRRCDCVCCAGAVGSGGPATASHKRARWPAA